ncbi:MAG: hypothetical protein P0S95_02285 [Rhabdochlamydiaceae bacterium]|nr:hypothetical protein [Candidatus Amphrikana amoebophyrae]
MFDHLFLFNPGCWIGEGKIQLNALEDELIYFMRWRSILIDNELQEFESTQEVQIAGHTDVMFNQFLFSNFDRGNFDVLLENQAWGEVCGRGQVDSKFIGWEFRKNELGFEGYEFYELQDDGTYITKAEFVTQEDLRTTIDGKIWKQHVPSKQEMKEKES